jgi:2,3-bisphosphoglycerate-independent phosphoglycerate mutase
MGYGVEMKRMKRRGSTVVVLSQHGKYPFQTGMVTASLLNRGLRMDDATTIARELRDSLIPPLEITSAELTRRIDRLVLARLGPEAAARSNTARAEERRERPAVPMVRTSYGVFPFSKGVILRHLDTSGVDLESAMQLVLELERRVAQSGTPSVSEQELHARVSELLGERHGEDHQRRYELTHWVGKSETPVIILIGGATGTGKSSLAMELAYRLGVEWVTSTDMVRETMRAVVSPALAPGLHDHSFRGMLVGGQVLSDPRERVLAGFRQQVAQVAVGIRAVVQRAIHENAHMIIEGTHLIPPLAQYLPADAPVHTAGFMLAVPDEREHRARFPERSRTQPARPAATYLDAFQSVRWIHDDLLRMAEEAETVVLSNIDRTKTLFSAVDILSRGLPVEEGGDAGSTTDSSRTGRRSQPPLVPTLMLIIDGMGDEPNPALGDRTPLAAASTPTLRRLAASGGQGQVETAPAPGQIPNTDEGILALLGGAGHKDVLARGLFEALGQGVPLPRDAILLRGNLATVEPDGTVLDRRAGRIRAGVEDLLSDLRQVELSCGVTAKVFPGHEHRVLIMLLGTGLSPAVNDTDPGSKALVQRLIPPRPVDTSPEAARTVEALAELLVLVADRLRDHPLNLDRISRGLLSANAIITRGAALSPRRREPASWTGAMVARCNTALGVARYLGMRTATSPRMTGSLDTDLNAKFETAAALLPEVDCVVVHVKGADIAAHDRRPLEKRAFIGAIDAALGRCLSAHPELSGRLRVVVSADHGTSSLTGDHLPNPVPLLLATWDAGATDEADFSEESASSGALGVLSPGELVEILGLGAAPHSLRPSA